MTGCTTTRTGQARTGEFYPRQPGAARFIALRYDDRVGDRLAAVRVILRHSSIVEHRQAAWAGTGSIVMIGTDADIPTSA